MFHYYKIALLLGLLSLAFAAVGWKNNFDRGAVTALRFALAILLVWAYLLLSRFIVVEMDLALAVSQEERQAIYNGDGAKNAVVLLFGWIPGIVVASCMWALARGRHWFQGRFAREKRDHA